ncbi:acyl-CoA synthetase-like protein [Dinothrombium tinctorium]|uniref:Medium-chain acyl-CoA ligase ACSF2, mitochondrial n=1 Tax=Dinothrombium tinctorium TaxID=1965070 RepID=A0A443QV11_9ACAR|nr:acyl-CoA synthetase-like protein [Dinothrombium tinctorium]
MKLPLRQFLKTNVSAFQRKINIRFDQRALLTTDDSLPPYVDYPWSYAFGKSKRSLNNRTVAELLQINAQKDGLKTAVASHHENIVKSFSELDADVTSLAAGLHHELGIRRGDVVGIWSFNTYNWIMIQYACAKIGAIVCTINPVYKLPELEYVLRAAKVKSLFMPGRKSKQHPANNHFELISQSQVVHNPDKENHLSHIVVIDGETQSGKIGYIDSLSLNDVMRKDSTVPTEVLSKIQSDDPFYIMFTSGTTGKPKGATLSHHTVVNNALLAASRIQDPDNLVTCLPLPLFHSFAATLGSILMSCVPGTVVLPGYWFNTKAVVDSIIKNRCTVLLATPTIIIDILSYIKQSKIVIDSLKTIILGAASVPIEVAHEIQTVIPSATDIRIGFGATELGPCTTVSESTDSVESRLETVGRPLDFIELKVVDPHTLELLKIDERGELLVRGHNVMLGYWGQPEKTKEVITPAGWYRTGDIATMDKNGYIRIVGRTKEMIIRGGENIYPREVEEILHQHPNVEVAGVCGVPDKRVGEELCAWIKLKNSKEQITPEDIKEFCKDKLTYFKIPKYIMFVEHFPMTATGKMQKFIMSEKSSEILGIKKN